MYQNVLIFLLRNSDYPNLSTRVTLYSSQTYFRRLILLSIQAKQSHLLTYFPVFPLLLMKRHRKFKPFHSPFRPGFLAPNSHPLVNLCREKINASIMFSQLLIYSFLPFLQPSIQTKPATFSITKSVKLQV